MALLELLIGRRLANREAGSGGLRHQLNVLQQRAPRRLHLRWADRALFIWLYRRCPRILDAVTIVRPETAVRWGVRPRLSRHVWRKASRLSCAS